MLVGLVLAPTQQDLATWTVPTTSTSTAYSTATMPSPSAATGGVNSETTTRSYNAYYGCWNESAPFWDGNLDAYVCTPLDGHYQYPGYYCFGGGYLSGTTCIVSTSTNVVKFSWTTPTNVDATGSPLVSQVEVVEATSCTGSPWTVVTSIASSTGAYTVSSPSSTEYYAVRTLSRYKTWTSGVVACTQG